MGNVYTQDLLSGSGSGSVIVPHGFVWVIRDISGEVASPSLGAPTGLFFSALGTEFYTAAALQLELNVFHWEGRVAVPEDEPIAAVLSGPGNGSFVMTGYTLSLP